MFVFQGSLCDCDAQVEHVPATAVDLSPVNDAAKRPGDLQPQVHRVPTRGGTHRQNHEESRRGIQSQPDQVGRSDSRFSAPLLANLTDTFYSRYYFPDIYCNFLT